MKSTTKLLLLAGVFYQQQKRFLSLVFFTNDGGNLHPLR